ncbi:MAG TPA: hypothetical protein VIU64_24010 [Polyangia bacterium]
MREVVLLASLAVVVAPLGAAAAEPGPDPVAMAEALFQQGKQLLERGDAHAACPKLAESLRLERATGTLLALAMCHEVEGRLASAWAEYLEVIARAKKDGRADREEAARQWAGKLEARLSTLSVAVPAAVAEIPGLRVQRDGVPLDAPAWSTAVPVDPGPHAIVAKAPGRETWTTTLVVAGAAEHRTVTVPLLAPDEHDGIPAIAFPALDPAVRDGATLPRAAPAWTASLATAGGVLADSGGPALVLEAGALHRAWGAALRGAWAPSEREHTIDGGGTVALGSFTLRACGLRVFRPHRRVSAQLGPELLLQLDRARGSGLREARSVWRAGWGVGVNGAVDVPLTSWMGLTMVASVDYAPSGWAGQLEVANRGEVLEPAAVRLLVAAGPRFLLDW